MKTLPVFVVTELEGAGLSGNSLELFAAAAGIADAGAEVIAICLGSDFKEDTIHTLGAHGAGRIILVNDDVFDTRQADAWIGELASLTNEYQPEAILVPHSILGQEIGPRLAFRLGTCAFTGCIKAVRSEGKIQWTRPCYGGNAEEILESKARPCVATFKEKCMDPLPADRDAEPEIDSRAATVSQSDVRTRLIAKSAGEQSVAHLETADVVIAGGRGMGGPENFELLRELAGLLGGAVGASRVACDLGWCPSACQVGLSGKTVAPRLYFAVGISGAAQHLAGCGNAGAIVAINTDADAEIYKSAHFGIVADGKEFLDAFIREIRDGIS